MTEIQVAPQRMGWKSRGDRERQNRLGDWSVRFCLVGIGLLIVGMMLAPAIGSGTSEKVAILRATTVLASVLALVGLVFAFRGIRRARDTNKSARSAGWGVTLALILAASVTYAYMLSVWIRS